MELIEWQLSLLCSVLDHAWLRQQHWSPDQFSWLTCSRNPTTALCVLSVSSSCLINCSSPVCFFPLVSNGPQHPSPSSGASNTHGFIRHLRQHHRHKSVDQGKWGWPISSTQQEKGDRMSLDSRESKLPRLKSS